MNLAVLNDSCRRDTRLQARSRVSEPLASHNSNRIAIANNGNILVIDDTLENLQILSATRKIVCKKTKVFKSHLAHKTTGFLNNKETDNLITLPPSELVTLYQVAQIGDLEDVEVEVTHLRLLAPEYVAIANKLLKLAQEFE